VKKEVRFWSGREIRIRSLIHIGRATEDEKKAFFACLHGGLLGPPKLIATFVVLSFLI
jgi:hypothetical protein